MSIFIHVLDIHKQGGLWNTLLARDEKTYIVNKIVRIGALNCFEE
jgi:hypothetical protein